MKHALFLCVCILVVCVAAQKTPEQGHSARATKLSTALAELRTAPEELDVQMQYLEAFPKTYKEYLRLFDLDRPLYDGHEYVEVISSLSKNHELEVGTLLVGLSKDAHYDADAPAYLQQATCIYAGEHTSEFLNLLRRLSLDKTSQSY